MFWRSERSDEQVVRSVLQGTRDDFALLVRRYRPAVYGVALAETRRWADAEDVVQETFLKAYQSLDSVRERKCIRAWLFAIAQNTARSLLRRRKNEVLMEHVPEDGLVSSPDEPVSQEARDQLLRLLDSIREEDRCLLTMHYFSGMRTREIAETLGISPVAARKRLQRAREDLGEQLLRQLQQANKVLADPEEHIERIMAAIAAVQVPWAVRSPVPGGTHPISSSDAGRTTAAAKQISLMPLLKLATGILVLLALCTSGWTGYRLFLLAGPEATVSAPIALDATTESPPAPADDHQSWEQRDPAEHMNQRADAVPATTETAAVELGANLARPATDNMQEVGSISGQVVDLDDSPLGDAAVSATGASASGRTNADADGSFTISILSPSAAPRSGVEEDGELLFMVEASRPGYRPVPLRARGPL